VLLNGKIIVNGLIKLYLYGFFYHVKFAHVKKFKVVTLT